MALCASCLANSMAGLPVHWPMCRRKMSSRMKRLKQVGQLNTGGGTLLPA